MKRHLVTGAAGSGGSYLAEYLTDHGEVYGISRWHTSKLVADDPSGVKMYECDLLDMGRICDVLDACEPDYIYHLASHSNVRASFDNPAAVVRGNVDSTINLLEAVRRTTPSAVLMLCSSSEVYGQVEPADNHQPSQIHEEYQTNPVSPYAVSKLAQDALGYAWYKSFGVNVIRTRMFSYLNPRRVDLFATSFAMQIARIEAGLQKVLQHGNMNSVRTFLDVQDAVRAYHLAATKGIPGEVYNIGGSHTCKVSDVLIKLIEASSSDIVCEQSSGLMRPADVTLQVPDCSLFMKRTGWRPRISFEESIENLLNHCRKVVQGQHHEELTSGGG